MRENRQGGSETTDRGKQLPERLSTNPGVALKVVERRIGIGNLANETFESIKTPFRKVRRQATDVPPRPGWVAERNSLKKWIHRF